MSKRLLTLGSVVFLEEGKLPVMIVTRQPILNLETGMCYFDYGGVNQLTGLSTDQAVYFNHDDISEILFEGYIGANEERIQTAMREWVLKNPTIPKGNVNDFR